MTIVDNRNETIYQFSDLEPGQCFSRDNTGSEVYMKTHNHGKENAVSLTGNWITHFNPSCAVTPLNCKLVIE